MGRIYIDNFWCVAVVVGCTVQRLQLYLVSTVPQNPKLQQNYVSANIDIRYLVM